MPHSFRDYPRQLLRILSARFPDRQTHVVDIGAGDGFFGELVRCHFPNTDAVEICAKYVDEYSLTQKYRKVFLMPAQEFPATEILGAAFLLGDVLEHLDIADAQKLLSRLRESGAELIIAIVPWTYEQAADHPDVLASGNPHEVHKQPDLTDEIFRIRYPEMTLVVKNYRSGMYIWDRRMMSEPDGQRRSE